jgi:hypothetical protein
LSDYVITHDLPVSPVITSSSVRTKLGTCWTAFVKFGMDNVPLEVTPNSYFLMHYQRDGCSTSRYDDDFVARCSPQYHSLLTILREGVTALLQLFQLNIATVKEFIVYY